MSSVADVVAPPNEEGTRATILSWSKQVGDRVRLDEPLLELETDKVTVEIASPASGELIEILKGPNEEVLPGQLLARIGVAADTALAAVDPQATDAETGGTAEPKEARLRLSPSVRTLLAEHGLSASDVVGSGSDGRITAQDVMRRACGASDAPGASGTPTATPSATPSASLSASPRAAADSQVPHTAMRRRIAEHMLRSVTQAPHVTTLFEADLSRVIAHRALHARDIEQRGGRLTLTAYFVAACARALAAHPQLNASFHEDALHLHADLNIGVGAALGEDGLIVPVLHRVQRMDLMGIALRLGQLVAAARTGKLQPADVRGGTFTISNHGVGGSLLAAPIIINQPQVAILGVGKVERRVRVMQISGIEALAVRSMCYLTLTIDHRAIDAFQANAFLSSVVAALEEWPEG